VLYPLFVPLRDGQSEEGERQLFTFVSHLDGRPSELVELTACWCDRRSRRVGGARWLLPHET
jgi:hypothetical protein